MDSGPFLGVYIRLVKKAGFAGKPEAFPAAFI